MNQEFSHPNSCCLITGASSGIGRSIADMFYNRGYKVFGIGRNFDFIPPWEKLEMDLNDTDIVIETVRNLLKENHFTVLVNSAGVAYYGLHSNMEIDMIKNMVRTNIEVPMIISSVFLDYYKKNQIKGYIFNISSVTACNSNTYGACYGATKAALSSFSTSIFDENRKHGIKIVDILPDMTDTNLYRNADFTVDESNIAHLVPEDVSNFIETVMDMREGTLISKVKLQPQLHRIKKKD